MKKKKKKFTLKKVKKLFLTLWKKVLEKLKDLKDKFMALPVITRKIIYSSSYCFYSDICQL